MVFFLLGNSGNYRFISLLHLLFVLYVHFLFCFAGVTKNVMISAALLQYFPLLAMIYTTYILNFVFHFQKSSFHFVPLKFCSLQT